MANEPLLEALMNYYRSKGRPLRTGIINTGGTFTNVPVKVNDNVLLEPAHSEEVLRKLFFETLGLEFYVQQGLLELDFRYLFAKDSSQMKDKDRQIMVQAIVDMYPNSDGILAIHGTDSGARTAQFFAVSLPYYDPRNLRNGGVKKENWAKPVLLVSSQEPALHIYNGKTIRRLGSDADRNLHIGLVAIAEGNIGEAGLLTNDLTILRGTASTKRREIDIPPYESDPAVREIAEYTAMGLRYPGEVLRPSLKPSEHQSSPFVIDKVAAYEGKVLFVYKSSHLDLCRLYLNNKGNENIESVLKKNLPASIIYVSVGAGNVDGEDYKMLQGMLSEGIPVFRVPIPGGRIPTQQIYNVPGHDIPAINMLPDAAEYKVQATLALADSLGIASNIRKDFVVDMVTKPWGLEILPQR